MEKLAIIGVGCLFPGGDTPEAFYQSLLQQKDCITGQQPFDIGFDRFSVPVDIEKLKALDENFINVSYIVHEALRSSGYLQNKKVLEKTGMIMGSRESFSENEFNLFGAAYYAELEKNIRLLLKDDRFSFDYNMQTDSGFDPTAIFNFSYPTIYAAQTFSIQGPAFAFDAACASSLYSIEMAAAYLNSGAVDMMVAGAVFFGLGNDALPKFFESLGVTAKPGESRPLDKNSGGMIANEGGGAVVLKRLADAERDGDTIYALIDSVGWSNSGRGKQVLAPSHQGQVYAYENAFECLKEDNITPFDIDYIECHATGTSVGDIVELNSLEDFYKNQLAEKPEHNKPLFGALKGNIGHLLTGSSIASLIKVIYSMKHNEIPATFDINNPMSSDEGFFNGDNMVIENVSWPQLNNPGSSVESTSNSATENQNKHVKRAAINGFGFGGSNAHLIVSEYIPEKNGAAQQKAKNKKPKKSALNTPMSVVGLSAHMGDLSNAKEVSDALFYGRTPTKKKSTKRLKGIDKNERIDAEFIASEALQNHFYFSPFEFDYLKNGVHPGDESECVNKELLLLKMADQALEDAGFVKGEPQNIAVIVAAKQSLYQLPLGLQIYLEEFIPQVCEKHGIELNAAEMKKIIKIARDALLSPRAGFDLVASGIGPIIANRISLVWNLIAPSFKLCCLENSLAQSLQLAQVLLESRDFDAVLVGVIDSDPVLESGIWHERYGADFDLSVEGLTHGEGVAAFVLKKTQRARAEQQYVYADIKSISMKRCNELSEPLPLIENLIQHGFEQADIKACDLGYLEIAGNPQKNSMQQVLQVYDQELEGRECKVGGAVLNFGQSFMMSSGASFLKAIMMLDSQFQPKALKSKALDHAQWPYENLKLDNTSNFWMNVDEACYASVLTAGFNQSYSQIVLAKQRNENATRETPVPIEQHKKFYKKNDPLIVVSASSVAELDAELDYLINKVKPNAVIDTLKQELLLRYQELYKQSDKKHLSAVFIADNLDQIIEEIKLLKTELAAQQSQDVIEWSTKRGSYFTSKPLAHEGQVCVCYPPSGLSTPSAVYELVSSVPEINLFLQQSINEIHPEVKTVLAQLDEHQKSKQELPIFMDGLVGGLCSELLYSVIGVKPDAFIGLSFGELVMNSVTHVYAEEQGADFIVDLVSPYIKRLSDPVFIRNYFSDFEFNWCSYFCTGDSKKIAALRQWVEDQDEVFLTINASPSNIIISGRSETCERGAKKQGCLAYPISDNIFVHTPLAMYFYDEIIETNFQHPYSINDPKEATYYKSFDCEPFNFTKEQFAKNVADCICKPIDFKGVLDKAYADGARLFIGLDGGDLCANWIDENLSGKEFATATLKTRGMSFTQSIRALTAKLLSHGVALNIASIYGLSAQEENNLEEMLETARHKKVKSLKRMVSNEPATISEIMLSEDNFSFFAAQSAQHTQQADPALATPVEASEVHATNSQSSVAKPSYATANGAAAPQYVQPDQHAQYTEQPATALITSMAADASSSFEQRKQSLLMQLFNNNALMQERYLQTQNDYSKLFMRHIAGDQGLEQMQSMQQSLSTQNNMLATQAHFPATNPAPFGYAKTDPSKAIIWDESTINKLTLEGLSESWGDAYKAADDLKIRVRLPAPPFMFVSRVISLNAQFGELKPSSIEMEYDIPHDAWYLCRGYAPMSVATESSHIGILLLSYIGVDVLFEGRLRFRAVDSSFTAFSDRMICAGETCRGIFEVTSLMQHKGAVLVFYTYNFFDQHGERLFQIKGLAGLFSEEELELVRQNKDVARLLEKDAKVQGEKQSFEYPLQPQKNVFDENDLDCVQRGRNDLCFGEHYPASHEIQQMYPPGFQVLNRITKFDLSAGDYGLGIIVGEADIDPEHWVFDAHFPNDPILPATFTIEGAVQLVVFFFHASGLIQNEPDCYFEPRLLQEQVSTFKFRDGVKRKHTQVRYEAMIRSVAIEPDVVMTADVRIYSEGKLIAFVDNIAFKLISPDVAQAPLTQTIN